MGIQRFMSFGAHLCSQKCDLFSQEAKQKEEIISSITIGPQKSILYIGAFQDTGVYMKTHILNNSNWTFWEIREWLLRSRYTSEFMHVVSTLTFDLLSGVWQTSGHQWPGEEERPRPHSSLCFPWISPLFRCQRGGCDPTVVQTGTARGHLPATHRHLPTSSAIHEDRLPFFPTYFLPPCSLLLSTTSPILPPYSVFLLLTPSSHIFCACALLLVWESVWNRWESRFLAVWPFCWEPDQLQTVILIPTHQWTGPKSNWAHKISVQRIFWGPVQPSWQNGTWSPTQAPRWPSDCSETRTKWIRNFLSSSPSPVTVSPDLR